MWVQPSGRVQESPGGWTAVTKTQSLPCTTQCSGSAPADTQAVSQNWTGKDDRTETYKGVMTHTVVVRLPAIIRISNMQVWCREERKDRRSGVRSQAPPASPCWASVACN